MVHGMVLCGNSLTHTEKMTIFIATTFNIYVDSHSKPRRLAQQTEENSIKASPNIQELKGVFKRKLTVTEVMLP